LSPFARLPGEKHGNTHLLNRLNRLNRPNRPNRQTKYIDSIMSQNDYSIKEILQLEACTNCCLCADVSPAVSGC
jgi:hypothetical protein